MTSGFDQLERELLAAEQRQARRELGESGRRPRRRLRLTPGALAVAVSGVVALVIGIAAVIALSGGTRQPIVSDGPGPAISTSSVPALVGMLGVLRQPQTAGARAYNNSPRFGKRLRAEVDLIPSLTRLVRLPHREDVFLYVAQTRQQRSSPLNHGTRAAATGYGLGFTELIGANGGGGCCLSLRQLSKPRGAELDSYSSARHATTPYFEIVPDGVVDVRWVFPRHPTTGTRAVIPPFAKPLIVTVPVRDNIAAIILPQRGTVARDTWYGPDGHVIATYTARP
jgi:hypothetical protein